MQLIGAFSIRAAEMLAHASARLGTERAYVVHGSDGLDEIATSGPTTVFLVEDGKVQKGTWAPQDFGVEPVTLEQLQGGSPEENAQIVRDVLDGQTGPKQDIVLVNAAAALLLAHRAEDVRAGIQLARESIDSGAAKRKLEELAAFTSEHKQ
jgi:anthranilate phosphoribosyltransferase